MTIPTSFGRDRAVASNGCYVCDLSIQAVTAAVQQRIWTLSIPAGGALAFKNDRHCYAKQTEKKCDGERRNLRLNDFTCLDVQGSGRPPDSCVLSFLLCLLNVFLSFKFVCRLKCCVVIIKFLKWHRRVSSDFLSPHTGPRLPYYMGIRPAEFNNL
ncbi:hypothetical protein AVEN_116076-1 [Araneus ventricosus]|uniref:Uncharacterized protein n=1 Tax=Araneus ventricosus TaxID=182803 RepID=A0A4Y2SDY4_ARAVE|nr:hypothetical protein AVEN_116076-1 [Araneus ventricosus]